MDQPRSGLQHRATVDLTPGERLGDILALLDDLAAINRASDGLLHQVQSLTGLRLGELQSLLAISQGAEHPRAVALATGQVDEAATATIGSLLGRGLVGHHAHPSAPPRATPQLLHVTDLGGAALQQAEGIQVRVLEAVVMALGQRRTSQLRTSIQALAQVIGDDDPSGRPQLEVVAPPAALAQGDPEAAASGPDDTTSAQVWHV